LQIRSAKLPSAQPEGSAAGAGQLRWAPLVHSLGLEFTVRSEIRTVLRGVAWKLVAGHAIGTERARASRRGRGRLVWPAHRGARNVY